MRLKVSTKHKYRRKVVKWFIPTDNQQRHRLSRKDRHRTMGSSPSEEQ